MSQYTITKSQLEFKDAFIFDAEISFDMCDNEIEVSEIKGDFDGISENEAIESLNEDSEQIFNECHLKVASYEEDVSAYVHHKD